MSSLNTFPQTEINIIMSFLYDMIQVYYFSLFKIFIIDIPSVSVLPTSKNFRM